MPSAVIGIGATVVGGLINRSSQKKAVSQQEDAARQAQAEQARIESMNRAFQVSEFNKQLARQQPFIDVGTKALPLLSEAVAGRGDASGLPATTFQQERVSEFLGDTGPQFIQDRALGDIEAVEQQRNIGRLSDLVGIGLGGTGSAAGGQVNLGSALGRSLATGQQGAADTASALRQGAAQRANIQGQFIQGLTGLPALAVSSGMFGGGGSAMSPLAPSSSSPLANRLNPLGLAPGQGL